MRALFALAGSGLFAASQSITFDFSKVEELLINFIVLGELPGTSIRITFSGLIIAVVVLLWLPFVVAALLWCKENIITKIDHRSHLESIAL